MPSEHDAEAAVREALAFLDQPGPLAPMSRERAEAWLLTQENTTALISDLARLRRERDEAREAQP